MSNEEKEETYLLTLQAIRERCQLVYEKALSNQTDYLQLNLSNLPKCIRFVDSILKQTYPEGYHSILPHSRLRHYDVNASKKTMTDMSTTNIEKEKEKYMVQSNYKEYIPFQVWEREKVDSMEIAKRVCDLITVSVLLDAGAGEKWKFHSSLNKLFVYKSSEGLAMAILEMFLNGLFSSKKETHPYQVDAQGLKSIPFEEFKKGFQVTEENPLVGLENRYDLLYKLGNLLETNPHFHSSSKDQPPRPGNMIDTLLDKCETETENKVTKTVVSIHHLWSIVVSLQPIFPSRGSTTTKTPSFSSSSSIKIPILPPSLASSDIFYCPCITAFIPFHKLSQWLMYTYIDVLCRFLKIHIKDLETSLLTGLAEYRNGGLFLDFQVLKFKSTNPDLFLDPFSVDHPAIVEWRACTIVLLDLVAQELRTLYRLNEKELTLGQVLEGTWKAGRAIAKELRPNTGSPPIQILRDGTIF